MSINTDLIMPNAVSHEKGIKWKGFTQILLSVWVDYPEHSEIFKTMLKAEMDPQNQDKTLKTEENQPFLSFREVCL